MRHYWLTSDAPDLPVNAFRKALGKNRPATLEGKGGSSPSAPDPWVTSAAQTATNQDTAAFNRALGLNNYSNPFGSQTNQIIGYGSGGAPIYQSNITANPQLQSQLNGLFGQTARSDSINQSAIGGLYGLNSQYGSLSQGLNALGDTLSPEAAQGAQQQGQNAAYQAQTQYLDPQFSQQEESLKAQLANQGLTPGSQAYDNAMLNFNQQKQRAYSDASNQSILTGSQIGTQNWQNQIAGVGAKAGLFGQIGQNLQGQAGLMGQQVGIAQTPYSNLQTIASMIPGYTGSPATPSSPADIAGAMNNQYQGQLASHNADVASSNQTWQTVGQLGSMAAMAFMMY